MTPRTGPQRRVSWDVIRVLATLSVVVQHATHEASVLFPQLGGAPFSWGVRMGANTLLVVSAYFVCVTLKRGRSLTWWWNRIARIIPAYLVAVLFTYAVTLVAWLAGWTPPSLHDLLANLLLLQSWDSTVRFVDPSYWTLPAQLFAFTAAAVMMRKASWWRHPWAAPALTWALVLGPLLVRALSDQPGVARTVYNGVVIYSWQLFGMGVAIWLWNQRRIAVEHMALLLTVGLVAQYVQDSDLGSAIALAVVAVVICVTAAGPDWARPLGGRFGRVITWLAGISFGIYLLNQQIGYFIALGLHALGVGAWPRLAAVIGSAVLLGWLLTTLVERPVHQWLIAVVPLWLASVGDTWLVRLEWSLPSVAVLPPAARLDVISRTDVFDASPVRSFLRNPERAGRELVSTR